MTIVHLSSSLGGGGAEQMVLQLAKQSNTKIKTIVVSISSDNTLEPKFIKNKIETHFLNVTSFKNKSIIIALKKLHNTIKSYDDVVFHCHQFHGAMLGVIYTIFYQRTPIVFTLHTNKLNAINRRWFLFLTKKFRTFDIIFSKNSNKWYLKNSRIIANGVNFKSFDQIAPRNPITPKPFEFLFLGRLETPKNPLYLITIVEFLVKKKIDNFVINIVGDGSLKEKLEDAINKKNLSEYFSFFGFQNKIKPFLASSHCLILPSLWEGMPIVILEAAASKLPIISTPVGSIPDFINNTNSCLSTLEDFHDNMIYILQNYDKALQKTEILHNQIKSIFDIDNIYKNHLQLYKLASQNK
jgi:glycosyltransferase involved in cell wall biosynthesis